MKRTSSHPWPAPGPVLPLLLLASVAAAQQPPVVPTEGTRRMAALLKERAAAIDPDQDQFLNPQRAERCRAAVAAASDPEQKLQWRTRLARQLLLAGDTQAAIDEFLAVRAELQKKSPSPKEPLASIRSQLAIAWLRLGEQENCLARHGPDSCIAPISGGGRHLAKRGAENALRELDDALQENPGDLEARWLYNIAAMALGLWPDQVAADRRVPPSAFASEREFPRFVDVAPAAGLDRSGLSGSCVVEDFDQDGLLDVVCTSFGLADPMRACRNRGDGTFEDVTEAAGLVGEVGGLGLFHGDFDNDGLPDLFVPRGAWLMGQGRLPNSLLRNRGGFTFDDVTEKAGLLTFAPTQTAVTADFDNDGWLDLFVGNESTTVPFPCELWLNRRDGTFVNVAKEVGADVTAFVKGAAGGDFDNDGRVDLYLSILNGDNQLLHQEVLAPTGDGGRPAFRFVNVARAAGVTEPQQSFPTWFFDYDNDGFEDILVAGYTPFNERSAIDCCRLYLGQPTGAARPHLYRNKGDGTFEDVAPKLGLDRAILVMGANFGDLDNDGWLDVYLGTGDPDLRTLLPNKMFRNAQGRRFEDVTTAGGFGHLQKGHGVAFADLDHDGDQDVYEVMGGAYSGDVYHNVLYENPGFGNHWLAVELRGTRSNRMGIGARVAVTLATAAGERTIRRTCSAGGSFGGNCFELQIGLGDATAIRALEVTWPASDLHQRFEKVALDQKVRVVEGEADVKTIELKRFQIGGGARRGGASGHE